MEVFLVDAFTDVPFSGNPTMICIVTPQYSSILDSNYMQKIASEINLSETVFVSTSSPEEDFKSSSSLDLRWFSPTCEVNMCGHGTLAAAHIIWELFNNSNVELSFSTLSGTLKATHNKLDQTVSINLPLSPCQSQNPQDFMELIKLTTDDLAVSDCQYSSSALRLLLRLTDGTTRSQLEGLKPNIQSLLAVEQSKVKGLIVTIKSNEEEYDFYSRYFAPWWGNPEDPVTGAAHTTLGPYWSKILDKNQMKARQCSSRGGDLFVTVTDETVTLTGRTCIIMKGSLDI